MNVGGLDSELSALGHGVACVDRKVEQGELDLSLVDLHLQLGHRGLLLHLKVLQLHDFSRELGELVATLEVTGEEVGAQVEAENARLTGRAFSRRFYQAFERARRRVAPAYRTRLLVSSGRRSVSLPVDSVTWIAAEDYYARVMQVLSVPGVAIVGHFDLLERWNADGRYFRGDEPWYRAAVEDALVAVARSGLLLELNTAGWRKGLHDCYPARWILERCAALGIPIIVNSDAHEPGQITWEFERAERHLASLEIEPQARLSTWLASR